MKTSTALLYNTNGNPETVLTLTQVPLPELGENDICIRLLAAPIHPSDFGLIQGRYGRKVTLPAVAGREGIGEVVEIGKNVKKIHTGMHIRMPEMYGTWREHVVINANDAEIVPTSLPIEIASMAFINPPTAWRLLTDFVPLKPGDWVIQNAATSAVGISLIQIANHFGIRTINIVRKPEAKEWLKKYKPTVVLCEDECKNFQDFTNGEKPKLGLNSVGGESVLLVTKCMADNGVIVTFGGISDEKIRFPTRYLIFNNLQYRGFWMDRWTRVRPKEEVQECFKSIYNLIKNNQLTIPIAGTYTLDNWTEALRHAQGEFRGGKVIFKAIK